MSKAIQNDDHEFIANTYTRFNLCIKSGNGAVCIGSDDREYIDFTSGIGVNALGYCDSGWVNAICTQAATLSHTSNSYYSEPCVKLAKALCEKSGFKKVFFANSGAEANEGAIKAARKYSHDKYGDDRNEIITLYNSFHGRTITTLSATGQDSFHTSFAPFTKGFVYADANSLASLQNAVSNKTCAIMLEMIQGEGGVVPLEKSYVQAAAKLCNEKDILLIVDEVQTGIGRTGSFFCCEQFDIKPDIVTAAKGLGGGLPIGAVLFGQKTANVLSAGTHGSTFGGNPIASAGASYVLSCLTPSLMQAVSAKGELIKKRLAKMKGINGVTGMGLMLGVDIAPLNARDIAEKCMANGLLVLTAKTRLRFLPPLTITEKQLEKGLSILESTLQKEINA
ncbi:MAG: aspartate aminotransferase family protein [Hydrogenoanaerobacterium sp.]